MLHVFVVNLSGIYSLICWHLAELENSLDRIRLRVQYHYILFSMFSSREPLEMSHTKFSCNLAFNLVKAANILK